MAVAAFSRQVAVFTDKLNGKSRSSFVADAAREERDKALMHNTAILGSVPEYETIVDGHNNAAEETVRPGGTIVYLFAVGSVTLQAAVDDAFTLLIQMSPWLNKRPGANPPTHYRDSFRLFVNGFETDFQRAGGPVEIAINDQIQITNLQPYARKIDRGWSDQAPDGVFESVTSIIRERYKKVLNVKFAYDRYPGFAVGVGRRGGSIVPGRGLKSDVTRSDRYPTIYMTVK